MSSSINYLDTDALKQKTPIVNRIILSWILGLLALGLSTWVGFLAGERWDIPWKNRAILQAILMSGIMLSGVWWLRKKVDKGSPRSIGLGSLKPAFLHFILGSGIILMPFLLTLAIISLIEPDMIFYNLTSATAGSFLTAIGIAILFESLPEEVLFRGYIYSNLNARMARWKSSLLTIMLFIMLPVCLVPIQKHVLGMEINIGGQPHLTASYIIILLVFGTFIQYLRVISKSIWVGVGFHTFFVSFDRVMGNSQNSLIRFNETGNETTLQIVFLGSLLLVAVLVIFYPKWSKQKIGWREIQK